MVIFLYLGPRTFRAFLDVGLRRTTTGNRVFAALKGAADGIYSKIIIILI